MALADVFDALISSRQYKQAWSFVEARELIAKERGGHFDPDVVEAFIATQEEFCAITRRFNSTFKFLPL